MYHNKTTDTALHNIEEVSTAYLDFDDTLYIGRAVPSKGLEESALHNPNKLRDEDDSDERMEVVLEYVEYLYDRMRGNSTFQNAVSVSKGKDLVCWCEPALCHGHALIAHHAHYQEGGYIDQASEELEERVCETIKHQRGRAEA